jgi:tetratricopeptide (TPR) repeat protein
MMQARFRQLLHGTAFVAGLFLLVGLPLRADDNDLKAELLKLNTLTGSEAIKTRTVELVKDKAKAKKLVVLAAEMAREAKAKEKASPFNYNASMILARAGHILKEHEAAELFYEQCAAEATKLGSVNKVADAYEGLMDLYQDMKKYNLMEEVCQKFLDLKGNREFEQAKLFVLERLIQSKARQGQTDEALKMAESLVQSASDDGKWYFLKLKAWVQHEAGKIDDSIDSYKESMAELEKSRLKDELKDRFMDNLRYVLSGMYVEADRVEPAAEELQKLVKKHPDNPTYKNDLGFIWCDHDMKLPEAEKLIREAIEADKKLKEKAKEEGKIDEVRPNAAYLDSLGWVLYKQKKYKEALKYLKEAAADPDEGAHIEIYDHVADCQYAMGDKKGALETLLKAIKLDDVSKRDAERRRKMTEKIKKLRMEVKID